MKLVNENGKPQQVPVTASIKLKAGGEMRVHLVADPGGPNQAIIGEAILYSDSPEACAELVRRCANLVPRILKQMIAPDIVQAPASMADKLRQGPQ